MLVQLPIGVLWHSHSTWGHRPGSQQGSSRWKASRGQQEEPGTVVNHGNSQRGQEAAAVGRAEEAKRGLGEAFPSAWIAAAGAGPGVAGLSSARRWPGAPPWPPSSACRAPAPAPPGPPGSSRNVNSECRCGGCVPHAPLAHHGHTHPGGDAVLGTQPCRCSAFPPRWGDEEGAGLSPVVLSLQPRFGFSSGCAGE